jgi:hypothetical protein
MTLNLSSSRIVIVMRSVVAIEASSTGFPATGQLTMDRKADISIWLKADITKKL